MVLYYGVYAPQPANAVVSPNGDGVAEGQRLAYKVVRPSTVEARLIGPGSKVVWKCDGEREPGRFPLEPAAKELDEGSWRFVVSAVDGDGQPLADDAALHRQRDARLSPAFGRQPEGDEEAKRHASRHVQNCPHGRASGSPSRTGEASSSGRSSARAAGRRARSLSPGTAVTAGAGSSPRAPIPSGSTRPTRSAPSAGRPRAGQAPLESGRLESSHGLGRRSGGRVDPPDRRNHRRDHGRADGRDRRRGRLRRLPAHARRRRAAGRRARSSWSTPARSRRARFPSSEVTLFGWTIESGDRPPTSSMALAGTIGYLLGSILGWGSAATAAGRCSSGMDAGST